METVNAVHKNRLANKISKTSERVHKKLFTHRIAKNIKKGLGNYEE